MTKNRGGNNGSEKCRKNNAAADIPVINQIQNI